MSNRAQAHIAELLKSKMGLDSSSIGDATVERAIRKRMAISGIQSLEEYAERLPSLDEEMQTLVEAVVIPETWFFRDRPAFEAVEELVVNRWIPAHPTGVLRMLSVACSTGEEPYSMAMTLLDCDLPPSRFHVRAVDISRQSLAIARNAVYGKNSFRAADLSFRDRFFYTSGTDFHLVEAVREKVDFAHRNLMDASFGYGEEPYDIIFCRNLLIYLDPPHQAAALANLHRMLKSDGVLFVGPAEGYALAGKGFTSVRHAMAFAYRKASAPEEVPAPLPRKLLRRTPEKKRPPVTRDKRPALKMRSEAPSVRPGAIDRDLEIARKFADSGRIPEAIEACEAHLREHGPSPAAYYLLGLAHDALGDGALATGFYRKVLYLAPDHPEALVHLALAAEKAGDRAAAERWSARARRVQERRAA